MNYNQGLFFYGFKAGLVQSAGTLLAGLGICSIFFCLFMLFASMSWLIGIVISLGVVIAGAMITLKGRAMRFDYQRQSGTIIHKGDW